MDAGDLPESPKADDMVAATVDIEAAGDSQMVSYQVLNEMELCKCWKYPVILSVHHSLR
jgi:hypothetical protein